MQPKTPVLSTDQSHGADLEKDQRAEHSSLTNVRSLQTTPPCSNTSCQATVKLFSYAESRGHTTQRKS